MTEERRAIFAVSVIDLYEPPSPPGPLLCLAPSSGMPTSPSKTDRGWRMDRVGARRGPVPWMIVIHLFRDR